MTSSGIQYTEFKLISLKQENTACFFWEPFFNLVASKHGELLATFDFIAVASCCTSFVTSATRPLAGNCCSGAGRASFSLLWAGSFRRCGGRSSGHVFFFQKTSLGLSCQTCLMLRKSWDGVGMLTFFELAHILDAMELRLFCPHKHASCYASCDNERRDLLTTP